MQLKVWLQMTAFFRPLLFPLQFGIVALARSAEYSGVGSAVARGCGAAKVTVGVTK